MPWPSYIKRSFDLVNQTTTNEWEYYGPYNSLLNHLFPPSDDFEVCPYYKGPALPGSIDFTTIYVVRWNKTPIFFIEIKPYPDLDHISPRKAADSQMRSRVVELSDVIAIPKLYGISALGTRLSVYEFTRGTRELTPHAIPDNPNKLTDVAPKAWWKYGLFEEEGEAKVREIVAEVKDMVLNLG